MLFAIGAPIHPIPIFVCVTKSAVIWSPFSPSLPPSSNTATACRHHRYCRRYRRSNFTGQPCMRACSLSLSLPPSLPPSLHANRSTPTPIYVPMSPILYPPCSSFDRSLQVHAQRERSYLPPLDRVGSGRSTGI